MDYENIFHTVCELLLKKLLENTLHQKKKIMNCEIVVTLSGLKHLAQNPNLMLNWRPSLQIVAEEPEAAAAWGHGTTPAGSRAVGVPRAQQPHPGR